MVIVNYVRINNYRVLVHLISYKEKSIFLLF